MSDYNILRDFLKSDSTEMKELYLDELNEVKDDLDKNQIEKILIDENATEEDYEALEEALDLSFSRSHI